MRNPINTYWHLIEIGLLFFFWIRVQYQLLYPANQQLCLKPFCIFAQNSIFVQFLIPSFLAIFNYKWGLRLLIEISPGL
ncbi:hypothetical protein C2G38_2097846 [Gigaspora rosea]|uniref:Uncharacterized protein n=1 Tax=Gigaspora rosea TaxID=44941 RepID=A0A397UY36_9GLOM|nr:hypothetical protein C2G38_2097846 [Gigaspora rosea]